ncbi:PP2C family protein-serine/threonine phosphatase [Neolewinella persica]|uniref:PP2C family protein-serine/threonine phosphatase n=1 Tax=Neolewinella persica TaxID=70998 RepID=UPI00036AF034|nr:protein phosphatase 2C domain-containing protein [Neolewinella persica]
MKSITFSHRGERITNEDYVLCKSIGPGSYLILIADGMGGYANGSLAAKIVAESIVEQVTGAESDGLDLQVAIDNAGAELMAVANLTGKKIGATVGGVLLQGDSAVCFWVGDVKVLHFRQGKLTFESRSHSLMNELLDSGSIRDASRTEKYRHVVTRAVQGVATKVAIDTHIVNSVSEIDTFVVYSDGVEETLNSTEIEGLYRNGAELAELVRLIETRTLEVGEDNCSLVGLRVIG